MYWVWKMLRQPAQLAIVAENDHFLCRGNDTRRKVKDNTSSEAGPELEKVILGNLEKWKFKHFEILQCPGRPPHKRDRSLRLLRVVRGSTWTLKDCKMFEFSLFQIPQNHFFKLWPCLRWCIVLDLPSRVIAPAQKVIVLRDYCELCGLPQHFSNPIHVLGTIYDAFKDVREGLGLVDVTGGVTFHDKNIQIHWTITWNHHLRPVQPCLLMHKNVDTIA
jgi:hypothetical protein